MLGLKTNESIKFQRYFSLVQEAAKKINCIFFLEAGDGRDFVTNTLECEDLQGWLIPMELVNSFTPLWLSDSIPNSWSIFFGFAIWEIKDNNIYISFQV